MKKCKYCGNIDRVKINQDNICVKCVESLKLIEKLKTGFPVMVHGKADEDGMHEIQCPNCYAKYKIKLIYR